MPQLNNGNNGLQPQSTSAGVLAYSHEAIPAEGTQNLERFSEEVEAYGSLWARMNLAQLDQSLGASLSSAKFRHVLGRTLSEYQTETVCGWEKLIQFMSVVTEEMHKERFSSLVDEWHHSQGVISNLTQLVMSPAYQQIIGMGEPAVPLIFRELEKRPNHWFWALKSITGIDPVSDESRGDIQQMASEWLEWGRKQGYQW